MGQSPWPQERVELLKKLTAEGLSCGQIAAAIGGVTRNAVIGKQDRLGLIRQKKKKSTAPSSGRKIVKPGMNGNHIRHHMAFPVVPLPRRQPDRVVPLKLDLVSLTKDSCRWVLDEKDQHGRALFCGHPQIPCRSYCYQHCCVVYNDMKCELVALAEKVA